MEDIINKTLTKIGKDLLGCAQECLNLMARDMVDPSRLEEMFKGFNLGAFASGFTGRGQQPAGFQVFDNPYAVFNLDRTATNDQVKAAYREMMRTLHPDIAGARFNHLAALVNLAYQQIARERGFK